MGQCRFNWRDSRIFPEACFSKVPKLLSLFRVQRFPLYLRNPEVLSQQTLLSSWFFLH